MKAPAMLTAFIRRLWFAPTMVVALLGAPIMTTWIAHQRAEMEQLKTENSAMGIVPLNAPPKMHAFLKPCLATRQIARHLALKTR
jgi:hypothetical protein